jgi:hypothetical protein
LPGGKKKEINMKKHPFFVFAAALLALGFGACDIPAGNGGGDITWTVAADGGINAATTALIFTFSEPVAGLNAEHITLAAGTGSVTGGAFSGSGRSRILAVEVNAAGTLTVSINKDGIETGGKTVTVYRQAPSGDITWTVTADGGINATTTALTFTFSGPVAGLNAEHITLVNGTGSVTKGALSGGGNTWTLALTVNTAGNITAAIAKTGIEAGQKQVTVYRQGQTTPDITYTVTADGGANAATTALTFTFSGTVTDLDAADITLASGAGSVTRGALSGDGTSRTLTVTVNTAGNITVSISKAGIEAGGKTVTVYQAPGVPAIALPPSYDTTVRDITFPEKLDNSPLSIADQYNANDPTDDRQADVYGIWYQSLNKMQKQSDNLSGGYGAVKTAYPQLTALGTKLDGAAGGEQTIHTQIGATNNAAAYLGAATGYVNTVLDSIFSGAERSSFDKYLTAYQEGKYYNQKQRTPNDNDFKAALALIGDTGLPAYTGGNTGAVLTYLHNAMLGKINTAMGVGTDIVNSDNSNGPQNQTTVNNLNNDLLNQFADISEFKALLDDLVELGFSPAIVNEETLAPGTISDLQEYFNGMTA